MNYGTLSIKPLVQLPCDFDEEGQNNGKVLCKDLLSSPLYSIGNIETSDFIVVNEYYIARPDLISLAVYGTDEYADVICKLNGISNPFEINENMVLYIPSLTDVINVFRTSGEGVCELIDNNSSIRKKKNNLTKQKSDARSPSMAVVGDTNYIIDKSLGLVFY